MFKLFLHGDNQSALRQELESILKKHHDFEVLKLEGKNLNLGDIKQALESQSLFQEKRLVIIENLFGRKVGQEIENYLTQVGDANLVLVEGKKVKPPEGFTVKEFKENPLIFKFLENLKPQNLPESENQDKNYSLILLCQLLKSEETEYIFSMLVRQIRLLILSLANDSNLVKDYSRLLPFVRSKLKRQAALFSFQNLKEIYQKLLTIDYENKTGGSVFPLDESLELLIAKYFK